MTKVKRIRGNKCQSIILIVTYMRCKYESNKKRGGRKNVNLRFKIEKRDISQTSCQELLESTSQNMNNHKFEDRNCTKME